MFSVLIPNYGYSPYIFECLHSVINQIVDGSFKYEIIFLDQSNESDFKKIKSEIFEKFGINKVKIFHTAEKGLFKARHKLMSLAKGDFIQFLDSDDYLAENCLMNLSGIIEREECDLILTNLIRFDREHSFKYNKIIGINDKSEFLSYLKLTNEINSVVRKVFRKDLYRIDDYVGCDFDIVNGEDKCFSLPISERCSKFISRENLFTYFYRQTNNSMSKKITINEVKQILNFDFNLLKSEHEKQIFLEYYLQSFFGSLQMLFINSKIKFRKFKDTFKTIINSFSNFFINSDVKYIKNKKNKFLFSLIRLKNYYFLYKIIQISILNYKRRNKYGTLN